ncbi:MAG: hypothetical protein P8O83_06095 [Flavobacteriaceae bacterium]|jgi:hypothetical protein|nr:hypothetical protein [bacterium]MDG1057280.1 hypothetical protein [Flavobacteriaceae bacterium]MDG1673267.1 hypothetical protein [Flavobacteriaceae bacterium]MDG2483611.1 hypothetical protein [Flavobacteriaceae bacterium]|tara:strand:+ start:263 stop:694 length:432 start_codon:yes stop_codon:yes gene_type:complete
MKKLFLITAVLFSTLSLAQDLEWDSSKSFDVVFDIDSASTADGEDWQMAISGQAGPYGMAYGSITFSNFSTDETQGEYFGYFFTQVQDKLFRGTTNGVWKKEDGKFKSIAMDNDKVGGLINLVTGSWDLVNRKVNFSVSPVKE